MRLSLSKFLPALVIAGLLMPLLALGFIGQYSRYMADDYCTTARALTDGVPGSVIWWYTHWAGQFTNWMLKGAAAFLGPGLTAVLPAVVLVIWVLAAIWTMYQIALAVRLPQPRASAGVLGVLLVFAVFDGTPSVIQSLYWLGAVIPYTLPLIGMTFLIGFIIYTLRRQPEHLSLSAVAIVASVTFIAGGLSEVYVAFQTAALGLAFLAALAWAPLHHKRSMLVLLGVGIVCSLAALVIIAAAPGNVVRRAQFPPMPLPAALGQTFVTSLAYPLIAAQRFSTIALPAAVLLPLLVVYQLEPLPAHLRLSGRVTRRLLIGVAALALILTMACLLPPIYATSFAPASRAYIMPQFILISAALACGSIMGLGARWKQARITPRTRQIAALAVVILLIVGPLASAWQTLAEAADFRTYAAEWDTRDTAIRASAAQGEQHIETEMLTVDIGFRAGLEPIGPEANGSINTCAAQYYGVTSLIARTRLEMGNKSR